MGCFLVKRMGTFAETEVDMKHLKADWQFCSYLFVPSPGAERLTLFRLMIMLYVGEQYFKDVLAGYHGDNFM